MPADSQKTTLLKQLRIGSRERDAGVDERVARSRGGEA